MALTMTVIPYHFINDRTPSDIRFVRSIVNSDDLTSNCDRIRFVVSAAKSVSRIAELAAEMFSIATLMLLSEVEIVSF